MKYWLLVSSFLVSYVVFSQNLVNNPYLSKDTCINKTPFWSENSSSGVVYIDTCSCDLSTILGCIGSASVPEPKFLSGIIFENQLESIFGVSRGFIGTDLISKLQAGEE